METAPFSAGAKRRESALGSEGLNASSNTQTLLAVVIGAVLATVGGFCATQLEAHLRRRERERSAALLFGEILSVIQLLTRLVRDSRGRGDPYGPITVRLLRAVRRETDTYDRNRESLFDLRDAAIRGQTHALMVKLALALEGMSDAGGQIALLENALSGLELDHPTRLDLESRILAQASARDLAFDFLVETMNEAGPILEALRPLARQAFGVYPSAAAPTEDES